MPHQATPDLNDGLSDQDLTSEGNMPGPVKVACRALMAAMIACMPALAAAQRLAAVWQPHEIKFHYSGFTTHYTCTGIRDKLRLLLLAFGARKDVKTDRNCMGDWWAPQPFNTVTVGFSMPMLPKEAKRGGPGETFPAEWRTVKLYAGQPLDLDRGDCELVEQFAQQVLPQIDAKKVVNKTYCVPHQETGNVYIEASVLMPVKTPTPKNGKQSVREADHLN